MARLADRPRHRRGLGLGRVALCVAQDRSDTGRRGRAGSARSRGGTPTGRRGKDRNRRPRHHADRHRHRYAARHHHGSDADQRAAARRGPSRRVRWSKRATSWPRSIPDLTRSRWNRRTGALAHDTGLLNQAKSDLDRFATLNRQDSIAKQQVTDQQFLVQQDEGLVAEDQASIDSAKLNLTYCRIVSPVTGRVGLRLVDPGNYVQTSSSTGLVVVTQEQPRSR